MEKYRYLFGPVPSRRFRRSLGVDLTPRKTCTLDCVFCQLGRTTHKTMTRKEYVQVEAVIGELDAWIKAKGNADYMTLSGSGEPTLHSGFGEVLRFIRSRSSIPAVLLTNGTLLYLPEVQEAASYAHVVKVSLSAWDQASFAWVNRPHPDLSFHQIVEGQKAFRAHFKGQLWLEVFLVAGMNALPSEVAKIAALAEAIRPDRIHLNTAVRPPAEDFAASVPRNRLEPLSLLFCPKAEVIADFDPKQRIVMHAALEEIYAMLQRRPCTAQDIAETFSMHANEVSKYLGKLLRDNRIRAQVVDALVYYLADTRNTGDLPERTASHDKTEITPSAP
ncbi:MAG: radical SAM protein [Deltaproteobacteria bacterium]|nr:radical SAM protein [Deltaproteobacteria bacterium]